ncbi:MAG: pseudouridine synthase [Pseudomonadota bacterium]
MSADKPKRINKFLADQGLCSRREAEVLIQKGWVKVNHQVLTDLSYRVQPDDQVSVDAQAHDHLSQKQTVLINKPVGYVSGQAENGYPPAVRLIIPKNYAGESPCPKVIQKGMAPAGRLDIDSTGLLIMTQNGKLAKKIIGEHSRVEKEYLVDVEGKITPEKIKKLQFGLKLDGKTLREAKIKQLNKGHLQFILTEGRKRQIRRMCELVDLKVRTLKRVRIGSVRLGSLPLGSWCVLNPSNDDLFS